MSIKKTKDNLPQFLTAVERLSKRVEVGVPSSKSPRQGRINNASLAYIHNYGAPDAGIPARPFMEPGIAAAKPKLVSTLKRAAELAVAGKVADVDKQLNMAGMIAVSSIRSKITEGIPPPLALSTVRHRISRRTSPAWRAKRRREVAANLAAGKAPGEGLFTPLIDTGALRNSITYVVRNK